MEGEVRTRNVSVPHRPSTYIGPSTGKGEKGGQGYERT